MAEGDLVSEFYQYEYNGLLLGCNTPYYVTEIRGLLGYPALRSGTAERFGNHGAVPGRHYLPRREFIVTFDYTPTTDSEFGAARTELMTALAPVVDPSAEKAFVFWHPGDEGKMRIMCRPVDYSIDVNRDFALKNPWNAIRFEASDPRHYSNDVYSAVLGLTPDTTGLVFPLDFPLNFGPATPDSVTLFNGGTSPSSWSASINGYIQGPRLEKVGTGEILNMPNLTVELGQTLVLDETGRTALLNGETNVRSYLSKASQWFKLDPGTGTTIRFGANGTVSGAQVTFSWRYTYWGES